MPRITFLVYYSLPLCIAVATIVWILIYWISLCANDPSQAHVRRRLYTDVPDARHSPFGYIREHEAMKNYQDMYMKYVVIDRMSDNQTSDSSTAVPSSETTEFGFYYVEPDEKNDTTTASTPPLTTTFNLTMQKFVSLTIVIPSAPGERDKRDLLRSTWLNFTSYQHLLTYPAAGMLSYVFVIGTAKLDENMTKELTNEHGQHQDLMFLPDLVDAYRNLSLKMVGAYRGILDIAPAKFDYLFKTDTDAFVNIPALLKRLSNDDDIKDRNPHSEFIYLGYFAGGAEVLQYGKWADLDWNLSETYLPYASGTGYVISYLAVRYISKNIKSLRIVANEDTQLALWMAPLNCYRIHELRFNTANLSRGCYHDYIVTQTKGSRTQQGMYNRFMASDGKKICKREYALMQGYKYNWTARAMHCCDEPVWH